MAKTKSALVPTCSAEKIQQIIQLKTQKKRMTIKTIAEKCNVAKEQVKLVLKNEKIQSNQTRSPPPSTSLALKDPFLSCLKHGDDSHESFPSSFNGGTPLSSPRTLEDEESTENFNSYDNSIVDEEFGSGAFDLEDVSDNSEAEQSYTGGGGGEDFQQEEVHLPTFVQQDSLETSSHIQNTIQFLNYVRHLERTDLQKMNLIMAGNKINKELNDELNAEKETTKQLTEDLAAANRRSAEAFVLVKQEKKQIENQLAEAITEKNRYKKENAVLQAAQNDNNNQCNGCLKKLVFTVGKMVVCRTCCDEMKSQCSVNIK